MNNQELFSFIKKIISIPSEYYHEDDLISFCNLFLKSKNLEPKIYKYKEELLTHYEGKNLVLEIDSKKKGPTILLNGHLDTVNISNGWDTNPFVPTLIDNKLYGLGSCDMKSGSAILIAIAIYFNEHKELWRGKIILTLVSDEEGPYGLGTHYLLKENILPPVDVVLSLEPSAAFSFKDYPVLCLGARGALVYKIDFYGKSAHASNPELGINALFEASKFILESKNIKFKKHKYLGKGSFSILKCEADGGACNVIEKCTLTIHRHIVEGEDFDFIKREAEEIIKKAKISIPYKIYLREAPDKESSFYKPYYINKNNLFVKKFIETIKIENNNECNLDYFKSVGDFNYFATRLKNKNGQSPIVFIYGVDGGNYHSSNEYVEIDTIYKTKDTIIKYLLTILKG